MLGLKTMTDNGIVKIQHSFENDLFPYPCCCYLLKYRSSRENETLSVAQVLQPTINHLAHAETMLCRDKVVRKTVRVIVTGLNTVKPV